MFLFEFSAHQVPQCALAAVFAGCCGQAAAAAAAATAAATTARDKMDAVLNCSSLVWKCDYMLWGEMCVDPVTSRRRSL